MRTVESTVYTFDELSDRAKDRARDWFRESVAADFNEFHADSVIDDAKRMAAIIGIDISRVYYSGFSSQGDGACFVGRYSYRKGSVRDLEKEAPSSAGGRNAALNEVARDLAAIQKRHFYRVTADVSHTGQYSHEHSTDITVYVGEDYADADIQETVTEALRDFMRWIYRQLEAEYEYQNSNEAVDESIISNEYEFDSDGNRSYADHRE